MDVRCQCGAVHFKTTTDKPKALYHCHCTECQKQSSSAFGTSAIFTSEGLIPLSESLENLLSVYSRATASAENPAAAPEIHDPATATKGTKGQMDCYFCKQCGVRVLHRTRDESGSERGTVSIKGGCVEGLDWKGGVHIYTRSAVFPIPEGAERFEGAPS